MTTFRFNIHSGNKIQIKYTPEPDSPTATIMDFNDDEPLLQFCRELGFVQGRNYKLFSKGARTMGRTLFITMSEYDAMVFKLAYTGPHDLILYGGSDPEA